MLLGPGFEFRDPIFLNQGTVDTVSELRQQIHIRIVKGGFSFDLITATIGHLKGRINETAFSYKCIQILLAENPVYREVGQRRNPGFDGPSK